VTIGITEGQPLALVTTTGGFTSIDWIIRQLSQNKQVENRGIGELPTWQLGIHSAWCQWTCLPTVKLHG